MASTRVHSIQLVALGASVLGTVALFLPFTSDVSPIMGITIGDEGIWMLALPFVLAPLALYLSLRLVVTGSATAIERRLVTWISLGVVLLTPSFIAWGDPGPRPSTLRGWTLLIVPLAVILAGAVLFWRGRRRDVAADARAVAALTCAYLPNVVLCELLFAGNLQIGAYVTIATAVGYALVAALIWRTASTR